MQHTGYSKQHKHRRQHKLHLFFVIETAAGQGSGRLPLSMYQGLTYRVQQIYPIGPAVFDQRPLSNTVACSSSSSSNSRDGVVGLLGGTRRYHIIVNDSSCYLVWPAVIRQRPWFSNVVCSTSSNSDWNRLSASLGVQGVHTICSKTAAAIRSGLQCSGKCPMLARVHIAAAV